MTTQDRALTSANPRGSRSFRGKELTFQGNLLYPQQSQLTQYEDAVTQRIAQLNAWGQRLGEGFGISFTTFSLNPVQQDFGNGGLAAVATMLTALTQRDERVSLERRSGRWGLYFTREPAALTQERKAEAVPLKGCALRDSRAIPLAQRRLLQDVFKVMRGSTWTNARCRRQR